VILNQFALRLGLITCMSAAMSAAIVLRPEVSLANANQLEGVEPAIWSAELSDLENNLENNRSQDSTVPIALQQGEAQQYTQEELRLLLSVLEQIQALQLRPQQDREIQALIRELEQLQTQGTSQVELSPQQVEQVQVLLESLTEEEIERLDAALGNQSVEVAVLSQAELQETLSILQGIQQLRLRPEQSQLIQLLINQLEELAEAGEPEVLLTGEQAKAIQEIVESLTAEEQERLNEVVDLPDSDYRLTAAELADLISILQEVKKLDLTSEQNRQVESLTREFVALQGQGDIELSESQVERVNNLLNSLTQEQITQLEESLPDLPAGRVLTVEELEELIAFLEAAKNQQISPEQLAEINKWLPVLRDLQAQGRNEVLLTGPQVLGLIELLDSFTQAQLRKITREIGGAGAAPSVSVQTPIGFGGYWRTASAGIVFVHRTRFTRDADASIAGSIGLGDPETAVGLDVSVAITGLSNNVGEQGNLGGGSLSFQLSRNLPNNFGIGVGAQNIVTWNSGASDNGESVYVVASKILPLKPNLKEPFSLAFLSLGLGNGIYRFEDDFDPRDDLGGSPFNVFGSAAINLSENVNGIVEWTGQDLTLGMSVVPFKNVPLVFTPSFIDVTGSAGDGVRFNASLVYSIGF
jgi:hypothetical protein